MEGRVVAAGAAGQLNVLDRDVRVFGDAIADAQGGIGWDMVQRREQRQTLAQPLRTNLPQGSTAWRLSDGIADTQGVDDRGRRRR